MIKVKVLILLVTILFTSSFPCFASQEINQETTQQQTSNESEVEELVNKLMKLRVKSLLEEKDQKDLSAKDLKERSNEETAIEKELFRNGVKKNDTKDIEIVENRIKARNNEQIVTYSANINPTFPSNVDLYTYTGTITVGSTTYPKKAFYVMPKTGSNMVMFCDPFNVYNTAFTLSEFGNKVLSIYANKLIGSAIGLYGFVQWLPYELLQGNGVSYTSVTRYDISLDLITNMKYTYIYYSSSDVWQLLLVTSKVYGREVHNFRAVGSNGTLLNVTPVVKTYEIPSPYFYDSEGDTLIQSMINSGNGFAYTDSNNPLKYYDKSPNTNALIKSITPPFAKIIADLY